MEFRLGEFQCSACDYFISAARTVASASGRTANLPGHASQQSPRRLAVDRLRDSQWGWRLLKAAYLATVFIVFAAGTLYKALVAPTFVLTPGFAGSVLFAALVVTGLAALVLFIDWRGFRLAAEVLVMLLAAASIYEIVIWDGKDQVRLVLLVLNTVLLTALFVINYIELRKM